MVVEFKYYLPASYKPNGEYNLYIQKQSGINNEKYEFSAFGNKLKTQDAKGKETQIFVLDNDYKLNVSSK